MVMTLMMMTQEEEEKNGQNALHKEEEVLNQVEEVFNQVVEEIQVEEDQVEEDQMIVEGHSSMINVEEECAVPESKEREKNCVFIDKTQKSISLASMVPITSLSQLLL
jgi:hypothetical protein